MGTHEVLSGAMVRLVWGPNTQTENARPKVECRESQTKGMRETIGLSRSAAPSMVRPVPIDCTENFAKVCFEILYKHLLEQFLHHQ